jgi:polysaccharide deacetylase family protein (PEP-CTERM system associated)
MAKPTNSINPINSINVNRPKATFFVLAWIAEKLPHLVREIHARGHEVASHGCNHKLSNQLTAEILKVELADSKKIIENIIGTTVSGFRAPSFSISDNVLKIVQECGYSYDSSYNSFSAHYRYGRISLNDYRKVGVATQFPGPFFELPLSNLELMGKIIPWSGGAYFRLLPWWCFRMGIRGILKKNGAYIFYFHPWELDIDQPKVIQAHSFVKFRHYFNIDKTEERLNKLIKEFCDCNFITCNWYLNTIKYRSRSVSEQDDQKAS